jgi:hypothetical protein
MPGSAAVRRSSPVRLHPAINVDAMFVNENLGMRQIAIALAITSRTDKVIVIGRPGWLGGSQLQTLASGIVPERFASAVTLGPYSGPVLSRFTLSPEHSAIVLVRLGIACRPPIRSVHGRMTLPVLLEGHRMTWVVPQWIIDSQPALAHFSTLKVCGESVPS